MCFVTSPPILSLHLFFQLQPESPKHVPPGPQTSPRNSSTIQTLYRSIDSPRRLYQEAWISLRNLRPNIQMRLEPAGFFVPLSPQNLGWYVCTETEQGKDTQTRDT